MEGWLTEVEGGSNEEVTINEDNISVKRDK